MNKLCKPKPLNYCIFAAIISATFISFIVYGKSVVAFGSLPILVAAVSLNWENYRKPMKFRIPSASDVVSFLVIILIMIAYVSVVMLMHQNGDDLSPYFVENKVFLISAWFIVLLVPLNRMIKPKDDKNTEQDDGQISSENALSDELSS